MSAQRTHKPTIPNGWKLPDGSLVTKTLGRKLFVEIFALSTGEFLYFFHDALIQQKLIERHIDHETFLIGGVQYVSRRYADHSEEALLSRIDEITNVRGLEAIAGMAELKSILLRDVIHPLQYRAQYERYKISIPNGVLLFGPPGCGKTYIARKIAEALATPFFEATGSDLGSPYIHATSKNISDLFKKAFSCAPSVLFFDEISSLLPKREDLGGQNLYKEAEVSEFLTQLEGSGSKGVLVIGATNFPERIDSAILRSGRMDKRIFIPPPDYNARIEMFKMMMDGRPCSQSISFEVLATSTEGFVASDIRLVVDNAARFALSKNIEIDMDCLQATITSFRPSISAEEIKRYSRSLDLERK